MLGLIVVGLMFVAFMITFSFSLVSCAFQETCAGNVDINERMTAMFSKNTSKLPVPMPNSSTGVGSPTTTKTESKLSISKIRTENPSKISLHSSKEVNTLTSSATKLGPVKTCQKVTSNVPLPSVVTNPPNKQSTITKIKSNIQDGGITKTTISGIWAKENPTLTKNSSNSIIGNIKSFSRTAEEKSKNNVLAGSEGNFLKETLNQISHSVNQFSRWYSKLFRSKNSTTTKESELKAVLIERNSSNPKVLPSLAQLKSAQCPTTPSTTPILQPPSPIPAPQPPVKSESKSLTTKSPLKPPPPPPVLVTKNKTIREPSVIKQCDSKSTLSATTSQIKQQLQLQHQKKKQTQLNANNKYSNNITGSKQAPLLLATKFPSELRSELISTVKSNQLDSSDSSINYYKTQTFTAGRSTIPDYKVIPSTEK